MKKKVNRHLKLNLSPDCHERLLEKTSKDDCDAASQILADWLERNPSRVARYERAGRKENLEVIGLSAEEWENFEQARKGFGLSGSELATLILDEWHEGEKHAHFWKAPETIAEGVRERFLGELRSLFKSLALNSKEKELAWLSQKAFANEDALSDFVRIVSESESRPVEASQRAELVADLMAEIDSETDFLESRFGELESSAFVEARHSFYVLGKVRTKIEKLK